MKLSMPATHFIGLITLAATLQGAEIPTGHNTPEGVACDAIQAYIHCDSKAWLATLVRPIYGKNNDEFTDFKKKLTAGADHAKNDKSFHPPKLLKCYKARNLSKDGPTSAAYALEGMEGDMFVDFLMENPDGTTARMRYHVLRDSDHKWYFEPRPDLCPLLSMGLNEEKDSTEVLCEAK